MQHRLHADHGGISAAFLIFHSGGKIRARGYTDSGT